MTKHRNTGYHNAQTPAKVLVYRKPTALSGLFAQRISHQDTTHTGPSLKDLLSNLENDSKHIITALTYPNTEKLIQAIKTKLQELNKQINFERDGALLFNRSHHKATKHKMTNLKQALQILDSNTEQYTASVRHRK